MRNLTLHTAVAQFTAEAGAKLKQAAAEEEIPFEVVAGKGDLHKGDVPLYCYRPLTGEFIRARLGLLVALASYAPAVRCLEGVGALDGYLRARGVTHPPDGEREQADDVLYRFLSRVFEERSEFAFDEARFELAYGELERALYEGRCVTELVAPLLGLDLGAGSDELAIGEGVSLVRPTALTDPPREFTQPGGSPLLIVMRVAHERGSEPTLKFVRARLERLLSALRLYERGNYSIGQLGFRRIDDGAWTPVAVGRGGTPRLLTLISPAAEDELRAFCNLIARRLPDLLVASSGDGEIAWALARFELGCERESPLEALSDYLLALRALLEPEGPASGRLAQRLAVICAPEASRPKMAARMARAVALEAAVIRGLARGDDRELTLVDELADHLRAVLRDILCGHLDADVRALADDLLADFVDSEDEAVAEADTADLRL